MVPWDARLERAAALLLITLLCGWVTSTYGSTNSTTAAASECQLYVVGGSAADQVTVAGMRCTGASADVAVQPQHQKQFQTNSTGVSLSSSCTAAHNRVNRSSRYRCLVTVCSGTVVLRGSMIALVQDASLHGVICAAGSSKLEVYASELSQNNATALACFDQAHLLLHGSRVSHNHVQVSGGGVAAYNNSRLTITGASSIHNNTALSGGGAVSNGGSGVFAGGNASVTITGFSSVYGNTAYQSGGGVCATDSSAVVISGGSTIHSNVALRGGGVFVDQHANLTVTGRSRVHGNAAARDEESTWGGGVFAGGASRVVVDGESSVYQNRGSWGGGLTAGYDSSVSITGGSRVHDNLADAESGGGVLAFGRASVTIAGGSGVYRNRALNSAGGLAAFTRSVVVVTQGSSVYDNTAATCAGVVAASASRVTITGRSSVHSNAAQNTTTVTNGSAAGLNVSYSGGGLCANGGSKVLIGGESSIRNNRALNGSGGGLHVSMAATVWIVEGSRVVDNMCTGGTGGGISVGQPVADLIRVMSGGRVVESIDRQKLPAIADSILRTQLRGGANGLVSKRVPKELAMMALSSFDDLVLLKVANATVTVSNSTIANNICTSQNGLGGGLAVAGDATVILEKGTHVVGNRANTSSGGGAALIGNATLRTESGVVFADNFVPKGSVGGSIAAFANSTLDMPLRGNFTKCSPGVYLGWDVCGEGEVLQHGACMCCAPNTFSFSNASDVSGCKRCPDNALCLGGSHVESIPGYWHSSSRSDQMHRCPLFTDACISGPDGNRCKEGHYGNLCGACQLPDYGMTSPLKCSKCMAPRAQFGLYIFFCSVTVVFVTFTVHATWRDNLNDDQSVRLTDLIKVLVQFLQYVVIIGSVSVPWPSFFNLQRWFQVASVVFGPSSGHSLSLDCWLNHYLPQSSGALPLAIQRSLVYFLAPLGVFVGVVLLQCLCWVLSKNTLRRVRGSITRQGTAEVTAPAPFLVLRKLPVTALVLAYYAYPTLVKAALGFFACLRIDRGPSEYWRHGDPAPLNSTHGYWTSDIQQECFAGYHRGWALGLGLPAALVLCVGVPVAMAVGLYYSKPKANDASFKEHFAFLYRNYRPECMWWEAVWAAQTVVLTLVSVFSFPMERYLSVLALLVVFWASAALQVVFKPYAMRELHRMHIISTSCLAATTIGALAVFAYEIRATSADVLRLAVTVLVLCVNVAFVAWCAFKLFPALKLVLLKAKAATVNTCARLTRRHDVTALPRPLHLTHEGRHQPVQVSPREETCCGKV